MKVCVLLVEDDFLIRLLMAESLRDAGFEVVEASSGDEALSLIDDPPKPLVMLVTDIHMPGEIDGIGVVELVHERWPSMPVIVASGCPDVFKDHWECDPRFTLLVKPFIPGRLIALVERAVRSTG